MRRSIKNALLIFFLLFVWNRAAFGQQVNFKKLTPPDGQSFGAVGCITQDENGIMWFATKTGLYSYDGNNYRSYRNDPLDPNSISSNFLIPLWADSDGTIWTGSLGKQPWFLLVLVSLQCFHLSK